MRCGRVRLAFALASTWIALLPASLGATTVRAWTDAELVQASDLVVRGRVLDVRVEARGDGVIETVASVAVSEDYAGDPAAVVEVRELGGTLGAVSLEVPGAARFIVGDDIVLALERK